MLIFSQMSKMRCAFLWASVDVLKTIIHVLKKTNKKNTLCACSHFKNNLNEKQHYCLLLDLNIYLNNSAVHNYADDTQIYVSLSADYLQPELSLEMV